MQSTTTFDKKRYVIFYITDNLWIIWDGTECLVFKMKVLEDGSSGGLLKLTKTQEWIAGDSIAPVNKKLILQASFVLHVLICI